jgi:phage baseplate assembly protein W
MADKTKRLGTDLRLLRNLDICKSSRDPGHDLATTRRQGISETDLETLSYAENMIQALFLRFLTPAGELAVLGHPEYGSRLSDLIGELNNETTRNRAKLFVLEAVAAEPRVQEVLSVTVTQNKRDPVQMDIALSLQIIESDTPLNLVFPFFVEGGATQ